MIPSVNGEKVSAMLWKTTHRKEDRPSMRAMAKDLGMLQNRLAVNFFVTSRIPLGGNFFLFQKDSLPQFEIEKRKNCFRMIGTLKVRRKETLD